MAGNPNAKPGLAKARLAYLYGVGAPEKGIPCRNKNWLLEVSCVDRKTLDKHMAIWNQEMETIARNGPENAFGLTLREGVTESHVADVDWLRLQMNQIKDEVDNVDQLQLDLSTLLERIADSLTMDHDDIDTVTKLLDRYFQHSLNRQKLLGIFLSLQKAWLHSSAMDSTIAVFETMMKEQAKRQAKQSPGDPKPGEPDESPALTAVKGSKVFGGA